ncbi:hypothetical protein [Brytella acorum]|uniref:Uncharacterized protein n=1 Tax=Brytella acorum TaxID=2959299 RepID=A0AA35UYI1_9PROT|nr:hypothetical protein [Brytella acorum]CAI9121936.1 hypothetical protein LMG32879_002792 [Brytella acorum]
MITLHDQIQMLRAELTSFYLSRRERAKIERELARALAAAERAREEE